MNLKSFPVQNDEHFLTVCRYVERNSLRANLVKRAEEWLWGSLWHRHQQDEFAQRVLSPWPVPCPRQWRQHVNNPQTDAEVSALRRSVNRGAPFGDSDWTKRIVKRLGLEVTLRPRGRPKQVQAPENGS